MEKMLILRPQITQEELDKKIELHEKWVRKEDGGEQLNLFKVICKNLDISSHSLDQAIFNDVDFINCKFYDTRFVDAIFVQCLLQDSNYSQSKLISNLFRRCILDNLSINDSYLDNNFFINTDIRNIEPNTLNVLNDQIPIHCPEEGEFIGFKKAYITEVEYKQDGYYNVFCYPRLVKLRIPSDAKRSSSTSNKCRCNKAEVLEITDCTGNNSYLKAYSCYDSSFKYEVGKFVEVKDFDDNRWNECSTGIHFFLTKHEAIMY